MHKQKRSDPFSWAGFIEIEDDDSPGVTLEGADAHIRPYPELAGLIADVDVQIGAEVPGSGYPVSLYVADTSRWPIRQLAFDLWLTLSNGERRHTKMVPFMVEGEVTR